jgi:uncharacterized membrane protein
LLGVKLIEWLVFLISVVPFIELRGAIPLALWYNPSLSPLAVFLICVALNILAVPIAYFILDFILPPILRRVKKVDDIFKWFVKRTSKHQRLSLIGLAAFVGVPLPVTGAYTGTLIAYIGGVDRKRAALAIAAGVIIAGALVWMLAVLGIIWIRGISS